jgi:hypothetical protein
MSGYTQDNREGQCPYEAGPLSANSTIFFAPSAVKCFNRPRSPNIIHEPIRLTLDRPAFFRFN